MKLFLTVMALFAAVVTAAAQPRVIAHRGYWMAPGSAQNSLASLVKADSIGVYGSEFDVRPTADDRLVVHHDGIFDGVDLERSTRREITALLLANGEPIPTLDAYLQAAVRHQKMRLVLEMKTLSDLDREDTAAAEIVGALRKYGVLERTDFISFSLNACLAFRKLLPDGRIFYLGGDLSPERIEKLGLSGMDYPMEALRTHPEWVAEAHARGLEVNVWTVNAENDMQFFIDLGADYITTDFPVELQQLIETSFTPAYPAPDA